MVKKVVISANLEHDVMKNVINRLRIKVRDVNLVLHDPSKDYLDLEAMSKNFGDADYIIVKVASESSLDLLYFAKIYGIPVIHDIDKVLLCKNKVALDESFRKIFQKYPNDLKNFSLPKSWTQNLLKKEEFKKWASIRMPFVIKSHYQHDKYMRFNFLVRIMEEIDKFCKKYSNFLYYDIYIQEFIECDGIERKVYVIGDKIFGIKRENPIYIYMRDKPEQIDVDTIQRNSFNITKDIEKLAKILSNDLDLKIFGFDLIKSINNDKYYLIDLNEFPGLRGINGIEEILSDYIIKLISS